MYILKAQPIRRQVLAATSALVVPFTLLGLWSANRSRLERQAEVQEQAGTIAGTAAAYLQRYVTGLDSVASALTQHPAVIALDAVQCDALFAGVLRDQPLLLNVLLTDAAGVLKGTALPIRRPLETPPTFPYANAVIASGKPVVADMRTGPVSGKPTVALAYPVREPQGAIVGVLALGLNLTELQTVFNEVPLPAGSVVTLSDTKGRILARSRDPERFIGTVADPHAVAPRDVPRRQVLRGLDGVDRFYGNAVVERGGWLLSVGIPTSVAIDRVAPLWQRNFAIAIVAIAATLLTSLWLSALMSRGVNRVREAVQRVAGGDLSEPEPMPVPNQELAQLQDAFHTMAANLRNAHDTLDQQVEQERRMREMLQSLQRQVVRQERLAAVGVLVSGVAHELNNPLQAILGTAEMLEHSLALTPEALEDIGFVKTQAGRAREIIRNLSRFGSQHSGPATLVNLQDVVGEVVQLRQRDLESSSITLDVETSASRPVYANFTELEQVTLNFVINAQQSIEASGRSNGRIRIRAYDAGKKVHLEVQDDGPGVSPEDEPKLFQPFFTTKPVGQGTGLGLSVSYGIIDSYGGVIGYRGNDWGGATFFFELPAADPGPRPSTNAPNANEQDDRPPVLHGSVSSRV